MARITTFKKVSSIHHPIYTLPNHVMEEIESSRGRTPNRGRHAQIKFIESLTLNSQAIFNSILDQHIAVITREDRGLIQINLLARSITICLQGIFEGIHTPTLTPSKENVVICKQ
jgi:hypothetical protein